MYRIIIACTVLLFLSTCRSSKENAYTLIKIGNISLPIDNTTKPVQINHQVVGDTLIILDDRNNLLFYSLENQKIIEKRHFPSEGEKGISPITGFLYHNADSLFLLSSYYYKLFLVNRKGDILKKYNLQTQNFSKNKDVDALPLGNFWGLMTKIDSHLYLTSYPYLKPEKKDFYKSKKICMVLDLRRDSCFYVPFSYPEIYQKYAYPYVFSFFHRAYNPKKKHFIYSFPADQHIQVVDKEFKTVRKYLASATMEAPIRLNSFTTNQEEHISKQKQSNSYYSIYYDTYRDVYYRFAQKKEKNLKTTLIILVFDKNFNKLTEFQYESLDDTYTLANGLFPFVAEKGLYLPNSNSSTEDFFEMNIYTLTKKE